MIPMSDVRHKGDARADFFVMLRPGTSSAAMVGVKFVGGDEMLKPAADAARAAKYDQSFPNDTPVMLIRRGTLACKAGAKCTFRWPWPRT